MKKVLFLFSFLFILAGCGQKTQPTTENKTLEVKKEIPAKKEVKTEEKENSSTEENKSMSQDYLEIKELGVKFPLNGWDVKDLVYKSGMDTSGFQLEYVNKEGLLYKIASENKNNCIHLFSKKIIGLNKGCTESNSSFAICRFNGEYKSDLDDTVYSSHKQFDGFYTIKLGLPGYCIDSEDESNKDYLKYFDFENYIDEMTIL